MYATLNEQKKIPQHVHLNEVEECKCACTVDGQTLNWNIYK